MTCVATDPLPGLSKCGIPCLSRLSRNALRNAFVVRAAAIHVHSVPTYPRTKRPTNKYKK